MTIARKSISICLFIEFPYLINSEVTFINGLTPFQGKFGHIPPGIALEFRLVTLLEQDPGIKAQAGAGYQEPR